MPQPMSEGRPAQPSANTQEPPAWPAARDHEMAVALPDWDLLPPAEFIARHAGADHAGY
ncbi:MAG TPA: hypothetical protein VHX38_21060 [Pseudonocardiaceae bacterium]|nr:hypothetical protein [Pseudonocardiaceae bacterium]